MTTEPQGVVSPSRPIDQDPDLVRRLWYADPSGETAVRRILELGQASGGGDDLEVCDSRGRVIFLIRRRVLADAVLPHLTFTPTRRGGSAIRAHKKKAPDVPLQRPGANQHPTITKEN